MIKMAFHFIAAMLRHQWAKARGYHIFAPPGIQTYRGMKCSRCEFNEEGQCQLCRCLILSKIMLALEECPIGMWHRVWRRKKQFERKGRQRPLFRRLLKW